MRPLKVIRDDPQRSGQLNVVIPRAGIVDDNPEVGRIVIDRPYDIVAHMRPHSRKQLNMTRSWHDIIIVLGVWPVVILPMVLFLGKLGGSTAEGGSDGGAGCGDGGCGH